MGRFCNGLLTAFRVVQYIFSIIALGCGAYSMFKPLLDLGRQFELTSLISHI